MDNEIIAPENFYIISNERNLAYLNCLLLTMENKIKNVRKAEKTEKEKRRKTENQCKKYKNRKRRTRWWNCCMELPEEDSVIETSKLVEEFTFSTKIK